MLFKTEDPVKSCAVYKQKGCAHVDGMYCDMGTCIILKQYESDTRFENVETCCPS